MRTTIDIADEQYAQLKMRALHDRTSVKALISRAVDGLLDASVSPKRKRKVRLPVVGTSAPGTLKISNETIYEYLDL